MILKRVIRSKDFISRKLLQVKNNLEVGKNENGFKNAREAHRGSN